MVDQPLDAYGQLLKVGQRVRLLNHSAHRGWSKLLTPYVGQLVWIYSIGDKPNQSWMDFVVFIEIRANAHGHQHESVLAHWLEHPCIGLKGLVQRYQEQAHAH